MLETTRVRWFESGFADRILPFDSAAARACAKIASSRRHGGGPIGEADFQIAVIFRLPGAALITRDVGDFEDTGVDVVEPWTDAES